MPRPIVGVAVAVAPLAIVAAIRKPTLVCLSFVIFSFFRIHEVFPQLYPLRIPQLLAMTTLGVLAWHVVVSREVRPYWSRELGVLALFFALVSIGIAAATNPSLAFSYWSETYVKIFIMTVAVAWLMRTPDEFALASRLFVIAGCVVAGMAVYNSVNGIGLVEGSRVTIGRDIGSVLGDPNDLALVLLFPMSFALSMLFDRGTGRVGRLLGLVGAGLILAAVIATQSRGGLLGLMAMMGVFAHRRIKSMRLLLVLGLVCGLVLYAVAGVAGRASGGFGEAGVDESSMGRLYAWGAAAGMALNHPMTGVGLDNFYHNYFFYTAIWDGRNHAVHSTWFGVLGETGILGFVVFAAMVFLTLRTAWRSVKRLDEETSEDAANPKVRAMAVSIFAGLVGFLVSGTFLTQGFTWPFYILLALATGVARYQAQRDADRVAT